MKVLQPGTCRDVGEVDGLSVHKAASGDRARARILDGFERSSSTCAALSLILYLRIGCQRKQSSKDEKGNRGMKANGSHTKYRKKRLFAEALQSSLRCRV